MAEFLGPKQRLDQRPTDGGWWLSDKIWPVTASGRRLTDTGGPVTAGLGLSLALVCVSEQNGKTQLSALKNILRAKKTHNKDTNITKANKHNKNKK